MSKNTKTSIEFAKVLTEIRHKRDEVTKILLDFQITMETDAIVEDWLCIIAQQYCAVCDELRMDTNDPAVAKVLRKKLVMLAAVVATWAETLEEEES